jgi:hypothetical protein
MIKPETRSKIKGFLEGFLEIQLDKHQKAVRTGKESEWLLADAKAGKLKPFHIAILPPEAVRLSAFERSFSTSLGTTFEECARLIALDNHKEAERSKELIGNVSEECLAELERVRAIIDQGHGLDYPAAVERVLKTSTNKARQIRTITDVYLKTHSGSEFYFEIKSPKPNKGQGIEVTDRLLRTHALRRKGPPKVNTFYAMAYNPYGLRENYKHSFAISHLDMQHQVVLQDEFWDIIGGKGTFSSLLSIYAEVGKEKGRQIIDRLGYDF